ncbi:MAG: hypothetical protein COB53_06145 [Elusimicrobia bacterium]|nr:MAG: hypothetical protein COB53_06145 [Elusimicrobiota bacterium]
MVKTIFVFLLFAPPFAHGARSIRLPSVQVPTNKADPLDREIRRLSNQGFHPSEKAYTRVRGGKLVTIIYKKGGGSRASERLYVYFVGKKKIRTLHMYPGSSIDLALASPHREGRIYDLAGDHSRIFAYHTIFPGIGQQKLRVYRYARGKVRHLADFDHGRFDSIDGDKTWEIISQDRPLGKYFMTTCKSFHTMAEGAFRTRIYAWRDKRLVNVSREYGNFFKKRIEEVRREVGEINARSTKNYGGFLSLSLRLYFDNAQIGKAREGWKEFQSLYPIKRTDPRFVKQCLKKMETEIRDRLKIPDEW